MKQNVFCYLCQLIQVCLDLIDVTDVPVNVEMAGDVNENVLIPRRYHNVQLQ